MSPISWYCGSHETTTVLASAFNSDVIIVRLCARFPWVIITPFGSLVDPDVYWRKAKSDGLGGGGRPLLPLDFLVLPLPVLLSVVIHSRDSGHVPPKGLLWNRFVNASLAPASFFRWLYSVFVRACLAPLLSVIFANMCSVSLRAGFGGKTGTATKPALRHARNAMVKSIDGGYTNKALWILFGGYFESMSQNFKEAIENSMWAIAETIVGVCTEIYYLPDRKNPFISCIPFIP